MFKSREIHAKQCYQKMILVSKQYIAEVCYNVKCRNFYIYTFFVVTMVSLIANGSEIMIGRLHSKTNCNSYQAINDLRHIFFNLLFILTSSEFHIILKSLGRRRSFRKINYLYRGFSGQCHHVSQQQSRSDKPVHYENAVGYHRYSFISGEGTGYATLSL